MSVTLDISDDFVDLVDNPQSAVVVLKRPAGNISVQIDNALESSTARDRALIEGLNLNVAFASVWNIPDKQLNPSSNGRSIMPEDTITITTGGILMEVVKADPLSMGSVVSYWKCVCRQVRG